jgi:hypothetical protein
MIVIVWKSENFLEVAKDGLGEFMVNVEEGHLGLTVE